MLINQKKKIKMLKNVDSKFYIILSLRDYIEYLDSNFSNF